MDSDRRLICSLATTGRVATALGYGIDEKHFVDATHREIWKLMVAFQRKYDTAPGRKVLEDKFPDFLFEQVTDPFDYVVEEFINGLKRRETIEAVREIAEAADDEDQIDSLDAMLMDRARHLAMFLPSQSTIGSFKAMDFRIAEYEEQAKAGTPWGITMGIPDFDDLTLGIQPHEYVTIQGYTGQGKSTLAQWVMMNAYLQDQSPMMISLEMGVEALFRKWDTMYLSMMARQEGFNLRGISYDKVKKLSLDPDELQFWKHCSKQLSKRKNDVLVLDDVRSFTPDKVYAEMVKHKPDIVCIDYITLMDMPGRDKAGWERITEGTRILKQTARSLKIPILGIAQANAKAADEGSTLETTAYSRSINQDSDVILGFAKTSDEMFENKQRRIRMLKNRDGRPGDANVFWDMDHMWFEPWKDHHEVGLFQRKHEAQVAS